MNRYENFVILLAVCLDNILILRKKKNYMRMAIVNFKRVIKQIFKEDRSLWREKFEEGLYFIYLLS